MYVSYGTPIALAISVGVRPSFFRAAVSFLGVMRLFSPQSVSEAIGASICRLAKARLRESGEV